MSAVDAMLMTEQVGKIAANLAPRFASVFMAADGTPPRDRTCPLAKARLERVRFGWDGRQWWRRRSLGNQAGEPLAVPVEVVPTLAAIPLALPPLLRWWWTSGQGDDTESEGAASRMAGRRSMHDSGMRQAVRSRHEVVLAAGLLTRTVRSGCFVVRRPRCWWRLGLSGVLGAALRRTWRRFDAYLPVP